MIGAIVRPENLENGEGVVYIKGNRENRVCLEKYRQFGIHLKRFRICVIPCYTDSIKVEANI